MEDIVLPDGPSHPTAMKTTLSADAGPIDASVCWNTLPSTSAVSNPLLVQFLMAGSLRPTLLHLCSANITHRLHERHKAHR